jgi:carbon monoxide dehydrogenase subunit G
VKFEQRVLVDAPRERVRAFLDDFPVAAKCLPGIEEVKQLSDNEFEGRIKIRVGPLGINFSGKATVNRESPDGAWRVLGEARDRRVGAGMTANVIATLTEVTPTQTEVVIDADVQFSGRLAELGQPLIKRKADQSVKEFAENLKKALS